MVRIFATLVLSLALMFQGMAVACAYGPMPAPETKTGQHAMADMDMAGMSGMEGCDSSPPCPGCPDGQMSTLGCMQLCTMSAGLGVLALTVPQIASPAALAGPSPATVAVYRQIPPIPPPIA